MRRAAQSWLPALGLYDYKARMYSPTLGRFLQTDPIGYGDGLNWYNYVRADPVNATDPSGLEEKDDNLEIFVDGKRIKKEEAIEVDGLDIVVRGPSQKGGDIFLNIDLARLKSFSQNSSSQDIFVLARGELPNFVMVLPQTMPPKNAPPQMEMLNKTLRPSKEDFCAQEDRDIDNISAFAGLSGATALNRKLDPLTRALAAAGAIIVIEINIEKKIAGCK
ncbi:MAG: RHS repeat-associated core domain-containing protein [Patescibacteria group bacterium]